MINLDTINLSLDRMSYFADILNTLYDEYDGNIIEIGGGYVENYNRLTDQSQVPLVVDEFVKDSKYKIIKTGREVYLSNI